MSKASDSGKAFIDSVLAKLPENLRAGAQAAFAAPEAAEALTVVGDGVLARSDYSKSMDDLKEKETQLASDYENLTKWYDTNKTALAKVTTLEAEIARLQGAPPPTPEEKKEPSVGGLTKEELNQILEDRDKGYAGVLALTNSLTAKHLRDFNEVLDVTQLVDYATKNKVDLKTAYDTVHKERIEAKVKAEEEAKVNKLREEIRAEERKNLSQMPYPVRNGAPSVLDILENKQDSPANHTVDTAVAEYERLQATRG